MLEGEKEKIINRETKEEACPYKQDLKETLLLELPFELREKLQDKTIQEIQNVIKEREKLGFKTVIGYHCSNLDLGKDEFVEPGPDHVVHYATDITQLYGLKARFLYFIEGSNQDKNEDPNLGWKTSHSKLRVIDRIKLTDDIAEDIGAGFAKCEYH
jgi:hypothetical protein